MDSIVNEQLLTTTIHISTRKLSKTKNIDGLLKYELKQKLEGICSKEGYILKDSIFIVQRSIGKVITINSESNIQYEITYKLKSIFPCKGDIYHCIIDSISKMGLIAYLDFTDKEEGEEDMLDMAYQPNKFSRLSCQLLVSDKLDGLIVKMPSKQG